MYSAGRISGGAPPQRISSLTSSMQEPAATRPPRTSGASRASLDLQRLQQRHREVRLDAAGSRIYG